MEYIPYFLEFVTGGVELLKAVLHGYAGGLIFIIIVKSLQKEQIAQILEFVTGGVELLKAVLHGYAGGLIFMK